MFDRKKKMPNDFFAKTGFNSTKNEPFTCNMNVCKNDIDIFPLEGKMEQKEYGENMPTSDVVIADIKEMLKKIEE